MLSLPPGAVCLASNKWDPHQAFRIGERAWGVQFHPEFDSDIMLGYLDYDAQILAGEGQDTLSLARAVRECPRSSALLGKFVELCRAAQ